MRLFKAFPSLKLNQIRETDDPSTPAVTECVFEAHCDAGSTELEATETDAINEAAAVYDVEHEQLLPSSSITTSTEGEEMGKVNGIESFNYTVLCCFAATYSSTLVLFMCTFLYRMIVVKNPNRQMKICWEQLLFVPQTKSVLPRHHYQLSAHSALLRCPLLLMQLPTMNRRLKDRELYLLVVVVVVTRWKPFLLPTDSLSSGSALLSNHFAALTFS